MTDSLASQPKVTLVVVPRERFSHTKTSLEDVLEHTEYPHDIVYVDAHSPKPIKQYLEQRSKEKGFTLIRTPYHVFPNEARNIGLREVQRRGDSKYVVFVDNDVVVKPGWLTKLVECAEVTGATVVGPLTCIGHPPHEVIHNAGGLSYFDEEEVDGKTIRRIRQKAFKTAKPVVHSQNDLKRMKTGYVEFHCMMARTDFFGDSGQLDEGMKATREHIDFCFEVVHAGGEVYLEPEAIVTSDTVAVTDNKDGLRSWFGKFRLPDFKLYDLPYFMLRWNHTWDWGSLEHLMTKYGLERDDKYFHKRYKRLGYRRHELLVQPIVQRLTFGRGSKWLESMLKSIENCICRFMFKRHMRRREQVNRQLAAADQPPVGAGKTPATAS